MANPIFQEKARKVIEAPGGRVSQSRARPWCVFSSEFLRQQSGFLAAGNWGEGSGVGRRRCGPASQELLELQEQLALHWQEEGAMYQNLRLI